VKFSSRKSIRFAGSVVDLTKRIVKFTALCFGAFGVILEFYQPVVPVTVWIFH
jgi:hypothetical protein